MAPLNDVIADIMVTLSNTRIGPPLPYWPVCLACLSSVRMDASESVRSDGSDADGRIS